MSAIPTTWAEGAARRVEERLGAPPRWWRLFDRGILLTARTDYRERPLSPAFTVRLTGAAGERRRVAVAEGVGRPLMILPGLYATLNESLFALIAQIAAERGRHVLLVEDRLASGTLALNGGEVPSLGKIGREIAAIAGQMAEPPDALALSGGAAAAFAAPPGTFARIAAWSAAPDLWEAAENLARHPMPRWHYRRVHKRSFRAARLPAPPMATIPAKLAADAPRGLPPDPLLLLHAEDDPVVPARSVRDLPLEDGQCVKVLPAGAHLGFGTLAGPDVYLVPFEASKEGPAGAPRGTGGRP